MTGNQQARYTKISKFLSLVLRHQPEKVGLTLDKAGWVSITELLRACEQHGLPFTLDELKAVVATSDKQRFALSEDGLRIRANQGHSVDIELGYQPLEPPDVLRTVGDEQALLGTIAALIRLLAQPCEERLVARECRVHTLSNRAIETTASVVRSGEKPSPCTSTWPW